MKMLKTRQSALLGVALTLLGMQSARAGTYESDFNSGLPPGMAIYGSALGYDMTTGGVGNSGVLQLVTATGSQQSSAIIADFDNGAPVGGFDVTFQLLIGGGNGADGMSFVYGDYADNSWGEEGPGTITGLTVSFDIYNNGGTVAEAPAIDLKWNNVIIGHKLVTIPGVNGGSITTLRPNTFVPVQIHADTDGTVDVVYNNVIVYTNFPIFRPVPNGRFGFGARTGGSTDNHFIDNLKIATVAPDARSGQPYLTSISPVPVSVNAGAAGGVVYVFQNDKFNIATNTVTMTHNGATVTPTVSVASDGTVRIFYGGNGGVLPTGASTNVLNYSTTSSPALVNSYPLTFTVDPFQTIPTSYAIASADTTKPGFKIRVHQYDGSVFIRAPGDRNLTVNAERELANWYIDPLSGNPYQNVADPALAGPDGTFIEPGVINWNYQAPGAAGNFTSTSNPPREDAPFPGIPGVTGSTDNFAVEVLTYLSLKAGSYRFGVNSDDGFRASFSSGPDSTSANIIGSFNGGRGSADSIFDFVIQKDGVYPFRLSYWQGNGGANCELFSVDVATGAKTLINDPTSTIKAYRESAVSRPYISRAIPVQNWPAAAADDDLIVDITDGGLTLDPSTIVLRINNTNQTVTTTKVGKVTTVTRPGAMPNLLPPGFNNVIVIYGFKEGAATTLVTNSYRFTVAPYYSVLPAANKVPASQIRTADAGFHTRVHQMDKSRDANQGNGARINGGGDSNRMPWPEVELNQGNINPTNGLAYPNLAQPGPNNNFTYDVDVLNFSMNNNNPPTASAAGLVQATVPAFPLPGIHADDVMPGLPGTGTSVFGVENYVLEAQTYLSLKRGVYIFGVNSDDGFIALSAPNPNDTLGTLLGFFNGGRGASGNMVDLTTTWNITPNANSGHTFFNVIVPEDGIYPFRVLYWQGGTGISLELVTINKYNAEALLVNDVAADPTAVPAYRTYTGPARPWTKFSVSPTPWDNNSMQTVPGPITMVGRTRNAVNSSDIYAVGNSRPWADVTIGGTVANGVGDATLGLYLDGVKVPAVMTTNGTDVTVSYKPNPPLASGSAHLAALQYFGTTNAWSFVVQTYAAINATNAVAGNPDPNAKGFRVKVVQATTGQANTVARAEAQLAGTPASVAKPGPEPDGTYIDSDVINWSNNLNVPIGSFENNTYGTGWPFPSITDEAIPGVPGTGVTTTDNIAAEITAYLKFDAPGYYRFGVDGDDGWAVKIGTPGVANGQVLFTVDRGAGPQDFPFSFTIPQAGLYPFRYVWYNGGGGANLELFSYDENGTKILLNDPNNPKSIKAYYKVLSNAELKITKASIASGKITIEWTGGGTLESATSITGPWTTTGNSTGSFSENVAGAKKFYRVRQ